MWTKLLLVACLCKSAHPRYEDRVMGQNFTDFKTSSKDRHIKHWTPYHVNDQRVYVVDFNYLLNGMQINYVVALLPDPLSILFRELPDLSFSLVFWRSEKLYEEFSNKPDASLTLKYKLDIRPGKTNFIWNEITGRLVIPCYRLGCPRISSDIAEYIYLGWIFDTQFLPYDPISYNAHDGAGSSRVIEVQRTSLYSLEIGSSRTFVLKNSANKVRLVNLHYQVTDSEMEAAAIKSVTDFSITFLLNYNHTQCFLEGRSVKPYLLILKLVERRDEHDNRYIEHDKHYIAINHVNYTDLYDKVAYIHPDNQASVTLNPGNHSKIYQQANETDSDIVSLLVRSTCGDHIVGLTTPPPTPSPSPCGSQKLLCDYGRCDGSGECRCNEFYSGRQCGLYDSCSPNPCEAEWLDCQGRHSALPFKGLNYTCQENLYFPKLGTYCQSDVECEDILFSHCANGVCVCVRGYNRKSNVVQGLRRELCVKNHMICDWDSQCHYIADDMICTALSDGQKKCVCGDVNRRDPDYGVCTELSNDEDVSGLASWKTGYTAAIVGAALFIFLILVFAGVVQQRSSQTARNNQAQINEKFANALQMERESHMAKERRRQEKNALKAQEEASTASSASKGSAFTQRQPDSIEEEQEYEEEYPEKLPPIVSRSRTRKTLRRRRRSQSASSASSAMLDAVKRKRTDQSVANEIDYSKTSSGIPTVDTAVKRRRSPGKRKHRRWIGRNRSIPKKQGSPKRTIQSYLSSFTNPPIRHGQAEKQAAVRELQQQREQNAHQDNSNRPGRIQMSIVLRPAR